MRALLHFAFDQFQSESVEAETKVTGAVLMLYNEHSLKTIRFGETSDIKDAQFELGYSYPTHSVSDPLDLT